MHTFVLPCRFNPIVFESVKAIRRYYPDDSEIIVIDSNSDDISYLEDLREQGVIAVDAKNKHYVTGAIWHAYHNFPRKRYCFLHDSMIVKQRLDLFDEIDVASVRYFNSGDELRDFVPNDTKGRAGFGFDNEPQRSWAREQLLSLTGWEIPSRFSGILGSAFICSREILEKLDNIGFSKIFPKTKVHDQAMERLWGVAFHHLGYDIKTHTMSGNHNGDHTADFIEKKHFIRL